MTAGLSLGRDTGAVDDSVRSLFGWRPIPRDDASTILGLQRPIALVVLVGFIVVTTISAAYRDGGVINWPIFALVLCMVTGAGALDCYAPGDPMAGWATALVAVTGPAATALAVIAVGGESTRAFWHISGCVIAFSAFACIRGRTRIAWLSFCAVLVTSAVIGILVGDGPAPWLFGQLPNVGVLLMATLISAILRPAAREIYALRTQTAIEAAQEAAAQAALAERDAQLARLGDRARDLLHVIADGGRLTDDQVERCHLVEARLRDGIRARGLDDPDLAEHVWRARQRGVVVTLLDDAAAAHDREEMLAGLRIRVAEVLDDVPAGAAVTVRVHPEGRATPATVVIRVGDRVSRIDVAPDSPTTRLGDASDKVPY
ncbi:hypothetical protein GCM10009624_03540 [Gordonia sinesedis]